jgi:hypothetical protein
MTETSTPTTYVERHPGDLLTAEDWNQVQTKIYSDIRSTAQQAADGVTHVANADDASHLEGKGIDALTEEITRRVLDEVRGRSGYQQVFKILKGDEITVIEHKLGTAPLTDIYKLEYFPVACREDDMTITAFANFYLYHSDEKRVRVRVTNSSGQTSVVTIDVQPKDLPEMGIPWAELLTRYEVPYTDTSSLDDLETEFWKAFFADPNDTFGDDQYCHSPWFERCCKEQQSVKEIKDKGDWNDILFQMRPRKTINHDFVGNNEDGHQPRPANVFVQHLDNNRTALWFEPPATFDGGEESDARDYIGADDFDNQLKVMVLLKV